MRPFAPADFEGAKPNHQVHGRGVKLRGATAHYRAEDLDDGPIIAQDVESVGHHDLPEASFRQGREFERRVRRLLSGAVAWHLDGRTLLDGRKTVVFKD